MVRLVVIIDDSCQLMQNLVDAVFVLSYTSLMTSDQFHFFSLQRGASEMSRLMNSILRMGLSLVCLCISLPSFAQVTILPVNPANVVINATDPETGTFVFIEDPNIGVDYIGAPPQEDLDAMSAQFP